MKGYRNGNAPATFRPGRNAWMSPISVSEASSSEAQVCHSMRCGRSHQRATLAILLGPAGRPVLGQPASEIAGLADVEQRAGGVVDAIDAGLVGDSGEKLGAELLVEGPHGSLSQRGCGWTKDLWRLKAEGPGQVAELRSGSKNRDDRVDNLRAGLDIQDGDLRDHELATRGE